MKRLDGKTALITGGASGIGLAATKRFVDEGATVYIVGRREDALEEIRSELGSKVRTIAGDITRAEDLERVFKTIEKESGRLDVLFANAGVGQVVPLGEIEPEQFDYTFNINVRGTLFTVQRMLPLLKPGASVILTGSTAGVMGTAAMSVYNASKAAVRSLARSWAQDLRGTGVRVNVLSPGATNTDKLQELLDDEVRAGLVNAAPLEKLGDPEEVAAVAAFLASDESSFMTGSEVFVDGGLAQI